MLTNMAMQSTAKSLSSTFVRQIISVTLNGHRLAAFPINCELTLDELRIQLRQRFISIDPDDQFSYKGFPISTADEIKVHI